MTDEFGNLEATRGKLAVCSLGEGGLAAQSLLMLESLGLLRVTNHLYIEKKLELKASNLRLN